MMLFRPLELDGTWVTHSHLSNRYRDTEPDRHLELSLLSAAYGRIRAGGEAGPSRHSPTSPGGAIAYDLPSRILLPPPLWGRDGEGGGWGGGCLFDSAALVPPSRLARSARDIAMLCIAFFQERRPKAAYASPTRREVPGASCQPHAIALPFRRGRSPPSHAVETEPLRWRSTRPASSSSSSTVRTIAGGVSASRTRSSTDTGVGPSSATTRARASVSGN